MAGASARLPRREPDAAALQGAHLNCSGRWPRARHQAAAGFAVSRSPRLPGRHCPALGIRSRYNSAADIRQHKTDASKHGRCIQAAMRAPAGRALPDRAPRSRGRAGLPGRCAACGRPPAQRQKRGLVLVEGRELSAWGGGPTLPPPPQKVAGSGAERLWGAAACRGTPSRPEPTAIWSRTASATSWSSVILRAPRPEAGLLR